MQGMTLNDMVEATGDTRPLPDILHKLQPPAGALASRPQESSTSPQKGLALSAEESVAVLARPVEPRRET